MAMIYVPDEMIFKIIELGNDKAVYVREAIKEKLEKEE